MANPKGKGGKRHLARQEMSTFFEEKSRQVEVKNYNYGLVLQSCYLGGKVSATR